MTNEIANLDVKNLPAHLRIADDATNEFAAGLQTGLDIPVLSIRGKEFRFRYQGDENSTRERKLDVVLLASRPHVSKRWYEKQFESGSVDMPDCFSTDGARPDPSAANIQSELCSRCPRNQFGSKITPSGKQGKECSDYKRMVVLPVFDGEIQDTPVLLDLPITSLKKMRGDRSDNQFLQEYTGALMRHGIQVSGVVTTLEFTDAEFPQVSMALNRATTEDEFKKIQALRSSDKVAEVLDEPVAEPPGPITETDDGSTDVKDLLGGKKAEAKPESTPPPAPKEPEPEPTPEPEAPDDAAVMSDVRKLLGGL